jgi:hypothetical protein
MWGLPSNAPVDYDTWRAGIHPEDISRVETVVQRCIDPEGERVYDIEYRVIRKNDGVERWIATRGKTSFKNGKPESFYGVTLDITDRKRFELDLETRSWNEPIGGRSATTSFLKSNNGNLLKPS